MQNVVVVYVPTLRNGRDAISTAIVQETKIQPSNAFVVTDTVGLMEKMIATYRSVVNRNEDKTAANCPTTHRNPRAGQRESITPKKF